MESRRTLILMRHGKSAYPDGVPDHDRPLAPRGQREAALGGKWLQRVTAPVDHVLCSSAVRTRETFAASGIDAPVQYLESLYGADPEIIAEEVGLIGEDSQTLLVIAHWPGIPEAALWLADNDDSDEADQMRSKFPTSAIAVLTTTRRWDQLDRGAARLDKFHVPR
ncbi:SixA phosphatase family protein [Hoyosella altamirensis]|nr:histidine phosphatase family protein [Hoyosella altamirensis]